MAKKPKQKKGEDQQPETDESRTESAAPMAKVPVESDSTDPAAKSNTPTPGPKIVRSEPVKGPMRKRTWWLIGGGSALVVILIVLGFVFFGQTPQTISNVGINPMTNTATGDFLPRQLDGLLVAADKTNPNIYAVMIENLMNSRPPSNLDKAAVVYEALAEGGITRFLALYPVGDNISEIGPVRSARPYYIAWAEEYNKVLYVHIGGSPQATDYLRSSQSNVIDFNQFRYGPHFWRDKTRSAPHDVFTSTEKLFLGLKRVAPEAVPQYTAWTFVDEADALNRPANATDIVIEYSSFNYRVTYKYDSAKNVYERYQGDTPHMTKEGNPVVTKNVLVLYMKTGLIPGDRQRLQMETTGEGKLLAFRNGQQVEGTWKKTGPRDRLQFLDSTGQPIPLNRGTIWISVVPTDRQVTF